MNYRQLGKSDLSVSEIGFGCMSLGDNDRSNEKILLQAADAGVNFFDTADLYQKGYNEMIIGKSLRPLRNKLVIATKVGNEWNADGSGWRWNPQKEYILSAIDKSLSRLQTDYIDLYQLHGGTIEDPIDEVIETFELLKRQGKIRYYGISSIRPNIIREYVIRSGIISVMMQYSLLDRRPEESCLDLLYKNNIGVLARGSMAKGLLIDKPADNYLSFSKQDVERIRKKIKETVGDSANPISVALQYVLKHDAISSAVVGIRTLDQLIQVIEAGAMKIDQQKLALLAGIDAARYAEHR